MLTDCLSRRLSIDESTKSPRAGQQQRNHQTYIHTYIHTIFASALEFITLLLVEPVFEVGRDNNLFVYFLFFSSKYKSIRNFKSSLAPVDSGEPDVAYVCYNLIGS